MNYTNPCDPRWVQSNIVFQPAWVPLADVIRSFKNEPLAVRFADECFVFVTTGWAWQANRSIPRGNKRRLAFIPRHKKTARNERFFGFCMKRNCCC
jgi:hypothetical protein